jgi:MFS family permease
MDSNLEAPLVRSSVTAFDWKNLSDTSIAQARMATGAMFFINGCAFSTWASRIPSIQDKLHVGTGLLGIALLSMAVGALIAMCFAGRLIATLGSRPTIGIMAICAAFCLAAAGLPDNLILLSLVITTFGLTLGTMDVAMNAHAVVVEKAFRRPIMSGFHALFSIGGIFGACGGAAIAHLNIKPESHFAGVCIFLIALNVLSYKFLLPAAIDKSSTAQGGVNIKESISYFTKDQALVAISVIMFCCFLTEGAIGDWSSVFMHSVLNTDTGIAALGYAAFSVTMAIGRLTGDLLVAKLGQLLIVRAGSALAALGLILVLVPNAAPIPFSIFGFALIGIGVANIVPIAFSAAGNVKGISAASAIATVALIGYFGLLAGPPVIGFLAEIVTLRLALIFIAFLLATMMFYSKWLASEQV